MSVVDKFGPLIGRILIALLFVPAGIGKIAGFSGTVGYIASKGLPLPPVAAVGAIIVEVGVGLALLAGFKTRYVALILALFTLATALIFHDFWTVQDAMQRMDQNIHFMKNLAIIGGLLFVAAHGGGAFSIDNRGK